MDTIAVDLSPSISGLLLLLPLLLFFFLASRHLLNPVASKVEARLGSARSTCPPRLDTRRVDNFNARISDVPSVLIWFPLGERLRLKVAQHIAASPAFISRRRAHRRWSHCCGGDEEDAADFRGEPGVSIVCLQSKPFNAPRSCNIKNTFKAHAENIKRVFGHNSHLDKLYAFQSSRRPAAALTLLQLQVVWPERRFD